MIVRLNLLTGLGVFPADNTLGVTKGRVMADRAVLGFLGFIFGGVTAAVMLVAVMVVVGNADGRFALDTAPDQIASNQ